MGISALCLIVLLLAGYIKLGGFNPVQMTLIQVDNYYFLGRQFEGTYKSDSVGACLREMRGYVQDGTIKGQPVIIFDKEPEDRQGSSQLFIGILLTDSSTRYNHQQLAVELLKREIKASRAIRVSKDAHISVMPNPDRISRRIAQYGRENGLTIAGPSIEIYQSNDRLVIEHPLN